MLDRIRHLEVLAQVAETGSFTRAAEHLRLPRSTVSTVVQALEARVGTRLLSRTTRQVSLTPDGEVYLERALRLLADFEEAEGMFRSSATPPRGRLRVDVPSRIGRLVLAPALPDFVRRYPEIELELGSTDRAIDLISEGVDCALRVGTLPDSSLVAMPLGELELVNCASPAYIETYGMPQCLEDLAGHLAVHFVSSTTGRRDEWEAVDASGTPRPIPMRGNVSVNNAETYIACCLAGLGLIQVPAYDVQDDLRAGRLIEVLPQARALPMPMHLVYPDRRHRSRRLHAFTDWVRDLIDLRVTPSIAGSAQQP